MGWGTALALIIFCIGISLSPAARAVSLSSACAVPFGDFAEPGIPIADFRDPRFGEWFPSPLPVRFDIAKARTRARAERIIDSANFTASNEDLRIAAATELVSLARSGSADEYREVVSSARAALSGNVRARRVGAANFFYLLGDASVAVAPLTEALERADRVVAAEEDARRGRRGAQSEAMAERYSLLRALREYVDDAAIMEIIQHNRAGVALVH